MITKYVIQIQLAGHQKKTHKVHQTGANLIYSTKHMNHQHHNQNLSIYVYVPIKMTFTYFMLFKGTHLC